MSRCLATFVPCWSEETRFSRWRSDAPGASKWCIRGARLNPRTNKPSLKPRRAWAAVDRFAWFRSSRFGAIGVSSGNGVQPANHPIGRITKSPQAVAKARFRPSSTKGLRAAFLVGASGLACVVQCTQGVTQDACFARAKPQTKPELQAVPERFVQPSSGLNAASATGAPSTLCEVTTNFSAVRSSLSSASLTKAGTTLRSNPSGEM